MNMLIKVVVQSSVRWTHKVSNNIVEQDHRFIKKIKKPNLSTAGGIGTVPGVMAGVLIFGVINYGLTFIGVNPYWHLIIKGIIIVAAIAFDIRKYLTKK